MIRSRASPDDVPPGRHSSPALGFFAFTRAMRRNAGPISIFKAACERVETVTNALTGQQVPHRRRLRISPSPSRCSASRPPRARSVIDGGKAFTGTTGFWTDSVGEPADHVLANTRDAGHRRKAQTTRHGRTLRRLTRGAVLPPRDGLDPGMKWDASCARTPHNCPQPPTPAKTGADSTVFGALSAPISIPDLESSDHGPRGPQRPQATKLTRTRPVNPLAGMKNPGRRPRTPRPGLVFQSLTPGGARTPPSVVSPGAGASRRR